MDRLKERLMKAIDSFTDDNADIAYAGQSPMSYDEWRNKEDKHYEQMA